MGEQKIKKLTFVSDQTKEIVRSSNTAELIICLCGPIGVDLHYAADEFKNVFLNNFNYEVEIIKLSSFIKKYSDQPEFDPVTESGYEYYNRIISAGNNLREEYGNTILAELTINQIAQVREKEKEKAGEDDFKSMRKCFIIDSIKNIEELELLKLVYTDSVYFVGIIADLEARVDHLSNKIKEPHDIYKLISRDSGEEIDHGQKVEKCLPESDIFIRLNDTNRGILNKKILRFCNLIFETEVVTPTANEKAMYLASAAAGNSACLSRQVGASISSSNGDILSVGWNDVPKSGGGVYYTEDESDKRCLHMNGGMCFNDNEKKLMSDELLNVLITNNIISEDQRIETEKIIKNSKIKSLIEFSRAVHAEMHAIIKAAQKSGNIMLGGKLFCTTYPCHNCARHIVLSGISEVYFIEPYRKSLAKKLHGDSITEKEDDDKRVKFLHYDGISPKKYLQFFRNSRKRKDSMGKIKNHLPNKVFPKKPVSLAATPILEEKITELLMKKNIVEVDE